MIRLFCLLGTRLYFTPSGGEKFIARRLMTARCRPEIRLRDGDKPSFRAHGRAGLTEIFDRQTRFLETAARSYPSGFSFALIALMQKLEDYARLVCVLPDEEHVREIALKLGKRFPGLTVIVKTPENADRLSEIAGYTKAYAIDNTRPVFYVCKNKTCYPANTFGQNPRRPLRAVLRI